MTEAKMCSKDFDGLMKIYRNLLFSQKDDVYMLITKIKQINYRYDPYSQRKLEKVSRK